MRCSWLLALGSLAKACSTPFLGSLALGIFVLVKLLARTGSTYECHWGVPEGYLAAVSLLIILASRLTHGLWPDYFPTARYLDPELFSGEEEIKVLA